MGYVFTHMECSERQNKTKYVTGKAKPLEVMPSKIFGGTLFFFESIIFGYVWKVMERPLQLYKNANTSRNLHGILNGSELLIHVILSNYYVLF